jgi:ribose transport system ATP-binding protein
VPNQYEHRKTGAADPEALLEMEGIVVEFGRIRILHGAAMHVRAGEIHALLGENGAGKSSLMKVLFGLYNKKAGTIRWRGTVEEISDPEEALRLGIAMIHQELPFATHLSVAQNIFLGRELRRGFLDFIDEEAQNAKTAELLRPFPVDVDPGQPLGSLSVAQQQIVAIAKALSTGADLIVLDEATTALSRQETEQLFEMLRRLKGEGKTFIMITHKLDEVFSVADRVTVMRDGESIAVVRTEDVTPNDLVRYMVGREVAEIFPERSVAMPPQGVQQPMLRVVGLSTRKLRDISFEVGRGEVVGIAGLMGAGRTSLFNAIFGAIPHRSGDVFVREKHVRIDSPRDAIRHGIAYSTEDRKRTGLALQRDIEENVALPQIDRHTRWGWVDDRALAEISRRFVAKLKIEGKVATTTRTLSGGNQQKVVLAKWLATGADIFLLDEPTRGIDVGAKLAVYELIRELSEAGKAVLLATSELPELMALSDRFLVFSEGRLVHRLSKEEATPERIVYYASMRPAQN